MHYQFWFYQLASFKLIKALRRQRIQDSVRLFRIGFWKKSFFKLLSSSLHFSSSELECLYFVNYSLFVVKISQPIYVNDQSADLTVHLALWWARRSVCFLKLNFSCIFGDDEFEESGKIFDKLVSKECIFFDRQLYYKEEGRIEIQTHFKNKMINLNIVDQNATMHTKYFIKISLFMAENWEWRRDI